MRQEIWTIVGGGHGGQTFAGHMALLGKRVRLHTKSQEKADAINQSKGICLQHAINGVGKIEFATTDLAAALDGATHIVMVLPSNWHESTTRAMVPHLRDGQAILILPEASCGAIAFRKVLRDMACHAKVILGAASSLPYATRSEVPGVCFVGGVKSEVKVAALPASDNAGIADAFCSSFPGFTLSRNVIETSIDNINAMMHPGPVLMNVSRIESEPPSNFEWYSEGMTKSVGKLLEAIDGERIAVASAFGIKQRTLKRNYIEMYGCGNDDMELHKVIQNNKGYVGIKNITSIRSRYVLEDVPYSLVPISAMGRIAGIGTPCIDAICQLYKAILGNELDEGRTLEKLGLSNMTKDEFLEFVSG